MAIETPSVDMLVLCRLEHSVYRYFGPKSIGTHPLYRYVGSMSIETPYIDTLFLCLLKHAVYRYFGSISIETPCL